MVLSFSTDVSISAYEYSNRTIYLTMPFCSLKLTALTHDQDVFSFYQDRFCNGFEEVLSRYKEIVPSLRLAG